MFRERTTSLEGRLGARRLALLQILGLAGLLVLVAALVYGEHAQDGGWIGDAWVTRAWYVLYPHDSFFSTVGHFLDLESMNARPANAVYRVALNGWFGADTGAWYAWQIGSGVVMCLAVYALMRGLGVRYFDAAAVVTLLVVFPAATSLWLWSPIVNASLSIALGAVGFLVALRAFAAAGRRRLALHAVSLLLFVVSLLLYEVCLPFFLASFLVYALRAPRREAALRWLVDCVVLVPLALLVSGSSEAEGDGVGGAIDHAWDMASQLPGLLFGMLLPFDGAQWLAFVLLAALYCWAGWTVARRGAQDPLRRRLDGLLRLAGAGLVVVFLGYLIYVPGLAYYRPLAEGIADRVNAVPAIGWTLFLYASIALLATLVTQRLRRGALAALAGTAVLALALGLSWVSPIEEDSRHYVEAYEEGQRMVGVVDRAVPDPRPGTAIWTFAQPVEISPGVPVFANSWNMSAAVALQYRKHTIRSFVGLLGTRFQCTAKGVIPTGNPEYTPPPPHRLGRYGSRYGRTYFVDTVNGQFAPVDSRARCLELRQAFPRATEFPPPS